MKPLVRAAAFILTSALASGSASAKEASEDDQTVHAAKSKRPATTTHAPERKREETNIPFDERLPDFRDVVRLRLGPLEISPLTLIQFQAIPYVGSDAFQQAGDPADKAGFRFRRARFGFDGKLYRRIPFRISGEFASDELGTASLYDAWFGYDQYKFFQAYVGAHDVPFSRYAMTGAGDTGMVDRPLAVRAMAPMHQVGVHVEGHVAKGAFSYYAGVYNAVLRNDQFFGGFIQNSAIRGNRFDGLTYAARLASAPLGDPGRTIQDLNHGRLRVAAGASVFFSNGGTRNILGVGGDFLLKVRGFHFAAEFLANRVDPREEPTQPVSQVANTTSYAFFAEAGYMILRRRLGVTARFEWLDPSTGVQNELDSWVLGGCVSYHLFHDFLRTQVEYTHRQELHGQSLKNDSVVLQFQLNL